MERPPQAPYLIMPYQLPLSSQVQLQVMKISSSSALQILLQKTPESKLPLSFSPCRPRKEPNWTELQLWGVGRCWYQMAEG